MKGIPHWQAKFDYLCRHQEGFCVIGKSTGYQVIPTELHHAGIHNTKVNRRKYPLLIHSLLNLVAVNHHLHLAFGSFGRISYLEADRREAFLRRHPKIAECANNPDQWMANL